MYLRAEIIIAFGKLHPLAGKLQPSLWGMCSSTVVMLSPSFKTKGNSSFPDALCVGVLGDARLKPFFSFCFCLFLTK